MHLLSMRLIKHISFIFLSVVLLFSTSFVYANSSDSSTLSHIDIDGNEDFDALTDGLLILRNLFGLSGDSAIAGAVAGDAVYKTPEEIESRIAALGVRIDIDDNGELDALTDGLIILRYLFGLTGDTLTANVVADNAQRSSASAIESYMSQLTILNAPPSFTSSSSFSAEENQLSVGTVTATDPEGDALTFSVSGSDLSITSEGVLTFVTAPDYETKSSYTATVTVSDGASSTNQSITVSVTNVNEAPIFSSSAAFSANENQLSIGSVTATDPEGDALTFSVSGSDLVMSSSGVLTFATAPDYETKSSYTGTIAVTDGSLITTQAVAITVLDVNEAPYFNDLATEIGYGRTITISDGVFIFLSSVTTVSASDPEDDTLSFGVSGTDADYFNISSSIE